MVLTVPMSNQLRITVTDDKGAVVARFDSTGDAQTFAEASTSNPYDARTLTITDRAGYITITYDNGIATGI